MRTNIRRFLADDSGAMFVEYSLIVILIGVLIIATISHLGANAAGKYGVISATLS